MRVEVVSGPREVIERRINKKLVDIEMKVLDHKFCDGCQAHIRDIKFTHEDGTFTAMIMWELISDE